jgi:hypothetical protein
MDTVTVQPVAILSEAGQILETAAKQLKSLEKAETSELVEQYHVIAPVETAAKKLKEGIRNALHARMEEGSEDHQGNVQFKSGQVKLQFQPRVSTVFDDDKAQQVLDEHDLLEAGVDAETVLTDAPALEELLDRVQELLVQRGEAGLAQEVARSYALCTDTKVTASQVKIEALVKKGKLALSDVERMFVVKKTFALYDVTGK